ncbi:MAG TPA: hypothetical protein VES42_27170 [Pilimelia sp.]|nr:hypothetical protein [Pilimelia sp.]
MRKITKRAAIIATAGIIAIGSAGAAFAYWATSGTGTATASADEAKPVTATATVAQGAKLYPGAQLPLSFSFTNPNGYIVEVGAITKSDAALVISNDPGDDCTKELSKVTFVAPSDTGLTIPADGGAIATTGGKIVMGSNASNACQGASFAFSLSIATGVGS